MSRNNSTMITPSRKRGQHLKFEDRVSIKIYRKLKYTLRAIADVLDCSPSTIMYEIKRGTGERNGSRGCFPEYNPTWILVKRDDAVWLSLRKKRINTSD